MKIAVVFANVGTPEAPTTKALRKYLAEFLWDARVVDAPRVLWWFILHFIVLVFRPSKSAKLYQKIWTAEGSPLLVESKKLVSKITQELEKKYPQKFHVTLAMRYGEPSLHKSVDQIKTLKIDKVLVIPMFPQYSSATTASVYDAMSEVYKHERFIPDWHLVHHYHDHPKYIEALKKSIENFWKTRGRSEKFLISFHGLPKRFIEEGDPYQNHCMTTLSLLTKSLQLEQSQYAVSFQSQFGREEWLKPSTSEVLAANVSKKIDVICPGFSVDGLETLEEIAHQNKNVNYIPALNDSSEHVDMFVSIVEENLRHFN